MFLLRGKKTPQRIFELIQKNALATVAQQELGTDFEKALQILHSGETEAALTALRGVGASHPSDGPTAFYIEQLLTGKPFPGNVVVLD